MDEIREEEVVEQVEEEMDATPTEDVAGDTQEEDVVSEDGEDSEPTQETNDDKPPVVTFEDFEKDLTERKSNVQKRIDKLTAEKYQSQSEVEALRKELEALKSQVEQKQSPIESENKPKYTEDQLKTAYAKAVADDDVDLQWQIHNELAKLRVWEAEQKYVQQETVKSKQLQEEAETWKGVVEEYSHETDPDFNVNDPNSLIIRVAKVLLNDDRTKQYLSRLGAQKYAVAIEKAKAYILDMRLKKKISSKTKELEKNLEKEKIKTSLSSGHGGVSVSKPKAKPLNDDRVDTFSKLFGI